MLCSFGTTTSVVDFYFQIHSQKDFPMKILFINCDGSGFADYIDVQNGSTVRQLFDQQIHSGKPDNYLIRVNRQHVPADQVLREGDRVSITPSKIEGALAA
jgi:hypothetical protein